MRNVVLVTLPITYERGDMSKMSAYISKKLNDYHVILLYGDVKFCTIEVFHKKDVTDIEYGELTQLILESQVNSHTNL